ncbi:MAG: hypothetical protein GF368_02935 [Candidatus Aenigmarchaeota archaeon]|nr:hypothetical protein [Candidatus Aenigmarchaeota archaeon]
MNVKHLSISNYQDIQKISSSVKIIHLRKFASIKLIKKILKKNSGIEKISLSKYVYTRSNSHVFDFIEDNDIEVSIRNKGPGRPNLLETIRI